MTLKRRIFAPFKNKYSYESNFLFSHNNFNCLELRERGLRK
nr:MAG TPA: hypothetical protein [Caudoviricetes sp.]